MHGRIHPGARRRARGGRSAGGHRRAVKTDRDGVIAQANAEWANDSTDAAIDSSCNQLPSLGDDRDAAQGCLAQADCNGFVSCAMPIFAKHLSK